MTQGIRNRYLPTLFSSLAEGVHVSDSEFDYIFSEDVRARSMINWTPVNVALTAVKMLVKGPNTKILDIGSGPGKFCFVGAATSQAKFFGVERSENLFNEAESIRKFYQVKNAQFIHADMTALDWTEYNAFYLFNPFWENIPVFNSDGAYAFKCYEKYYKCIDFVKEKLSQMPYGTRVVTYHGFGGNMPDDYDLEDMKKIESDYLRSWVKY